MRYDNGMSKITAETTAALLAVFAGQTVTDDEVYGQIEQEYALARKRTSMGSFATILGALYHRHGVETTYTGPNCTGQCLYTFPASA